jgi:AcrR family transcriptional regulator
VPRIVDHVRRREEIARLAVRVIQREGAEGASVRRIATAGGFSIGVLSHYFKDKDELIAFAFQWVAREWFTEVDAALAATAPGLPRLRAALEFMVLRHRFIRLWLSLWAAPCTTDAGARAPRILRTLAALPHSPSRGGGARWCHPRAALVA